MSQRPVPGAVITLLDAQGQVVGRTLASPSGQYTMLAPEKAARVRVVRIGWRPRERALPAMIDGSATANFTMPAIPTFLEAARVDARQCPKRNDSRIALGLWEQVRDGLLAMIVAREQNLGSMVLLDFERTYRDLDEAEVLFALKRTTTVRTPNSYKAVRTAANFIRYGFASAPADTERVYYAPDADVLIDPGFADGYCFRIVRGDRNRPNQVGLGFNSPERRVGRVDIDGMLWVDTAAKSIREIDFRYVGIHDRVDELRPGGTITFKELLSGVPFIQRWQIRLIGSRPDTIDTPRGKRLVDHFHTAIGGGELAHARWSDGTTYDADLGRAKLTLRTPDGVPAMGRVVGLGNTPYAKKLDESGIFDVEDLLPGTYSLIIGEPRLRPLQMDSMPTPIRITASRGTTQLVSATIPTLEQWTRERCERQQRVTPGDTTLVLVRVLDINAKPVKRASFVVEAARLDPRIETAPVSWETILDGGRSDLDGLLQVCTSKVVASAPKIRITGRLPDGEPYGAEIDVAGGRLTVAPIIIPRAVRQ